MTNFVQKGDTLTVTAPAEVTSGSLVVVGSLIGVAAFDAASGADVEIKTTGVFTLPKTTTDVVTQGAALYWNASTEKLTITPGTDSKPLVGLATTAAGSGATTVNCLLTRTHQIGPSA